MIAWYWLIPALFGGTLLGWLVAALCVAASRSDRHFDPYKDDDYGH
jgi:hypothetical protein